MLKHGLPFGLAAILANVAFASNLPPQSVASHDFGNLPINFEANISPSDSGVQFIAHGRNGSLLLTPTEAWLAIQNHGNTKPPSVLGLTLVGANSSPTLEGLGKLPGTANYLTGTDPSLWRTNVPTFAQVKYHDVYPGVDLIYYGNQQNLEYDFVIQPGANPGNILLQFSGADQMTLDANGDLLLRVGGDSIRQHKPIVYQEIGGEHKMLAGDYVLHSGMQAGFQLADYDRAKPLIIDPVLAYAATFGGSAKNQALAMARDADDNLYLTGTTTSTDFPLTNAFQSTFLGNQDAFVTKIGTNGAIVYSTYLGGGQLFTLNQSSAGEAIAVDGFSNAFVAGFTQVTNFPIKNAVQTTNGGGVDAFVTALNPAGNGLVYSTYLGGKSFDFASGIALDDDGNAIITGNTQSTNFPTFHAAQPTNGGNGDAFVTKLDINGALIYSTYLGGNDSEDNGTKNLITSVPTALADSGGAVAVGPFGNAFVTGWTFSTNFPVLNPFQASNNAFSPGFGANAFITEFDTNGNIVYSTYFGDPAGNFSRAIGVDLENNVYIAGNDSVGLLPVKNAFQSSFGGTGVANIGDAFVAAFDSTGTNLVYCTLLGGSGDDEVNAIAVRDDGVAVVTGFTDSINFPTFNNVQPAGFQGIFKSTDTGNNWNLSNSGLTTGNILSIKVDPSNPSIVYALTSTGCFKSTDAGAHWASASIGLTSIASLVENEASGAGLLAMDPVHPATLYSAAFGSIFKTTNGAASWVNLPLPGSPSVQCITVDPTTPTILYVGTFNAGVFKSTDGGVSWTASTTGLNNTTVLSLLVDPNNSSNVYAGVDNFLSLSLFKSSNGGSTWTLASTGLPSAPVPTLVFNPANSAIYAIAGNFFESAALCVSSNGGTSWTKLFQAPGLKFTALAIGASSGSSPAPALTITPSGTNDVLLWPAAFTNFTLQFTPSLNPTNWQNVSPSQAVINGNNVVTNGVHGVQGYYRLVSTNGSNNSASAAQIFYLGTDAASVQGVLVSSDGGASWNIAGPTGDTITAVAVNPANAAVAYTGINGGRDAFVSAFAPDGQLIASTYLGGSGGDQGNGVALDVTDVFVAGSTTSSDFPSVAAPFVIKPLYEGNAPISGTNNGGSGQDFGGFFAVMLARDMACPEGETIVGFITLGFEDDFRASELNSRLTATLNGTLPPGFTLRRQPGTSRFQIIGKDTDITTVDKVFKFDVVLTDDVNANILCQWTNHYIITVKASSP